MPIPKRLVYAVCRSKDTIQNSEKDYRFCETGRSNRLVVIIVVVLMKNRISSAFVQELKVLMFADLMYNCIVVVESLRHSILITL